VKSFAKDRKSRQNINAGVFFVENPVELRKDEIKKGYRENTVRTCKI